MQVKQKFQANQMDAAADDAALMLKSLSNPGRLRILCALVPSDMTVGELEVAMDATQSYVSGQLLRLRSDGLVACERDGRIMRYRLADARVRPILEALYGIFCADLGQNDPDNHTHEADNGHQ